MTEKLKILVCGDVEGKFKTLFNRVESIITKNGPFDLLLCAGNFFGTSLNSWKPYHSGISKVPIPTYILGPITEDQVPFYPDINGCELCPNVTYIGKRGLFSGLSGLKLAYISGNYSSDEIYQDHTVKKDDFIAVRDICIRGNSNFKGVDILISSVWPKEIMNLDRKPGMAEPGGSAFLSWLASEIKPRYHFCALEGIFYERRPYRNINSTGDALAHATRFIALAKVANPRKEKWIYALNIEPIDGMKANVLYQQTTDETESPYRRDMLIQTVQPQNEEKHSQFFYDMESSGDNHYKRKRIRKDGDCVPKRRPPPVFDQSTCWFCLASPQVEKHLIISVGEEAYLALAKGPLVADHVLVLPVGHHQSLSSAPQNVLKEIEKFKSALKKYFGKRDKMPVFFERNFKSSHLQIQVIPVSSKITSTLKGEFQEKAEAEGFSLDELPEFAKLEQIAPPGTPYFYVELPTGDKLFHRTHKSFPLQFGRDVMASEFVLNKPERTDWKDCKMSKEEETDLVQKFRTSFEEFDFTL